MQIGGSLPPRSHAVPIVSSPIHGDRLPSSCMCNTLGMATTIDMGQPPSSRCLPPPSCNPGIAPLALRGEETIATPATSHPRLPGAEAGWRYALPPSLLLLESE